MKKTVWQKMLDGLDQSHQAPAVKETRNAVVAAGAGSGKTRVLATRYLWLVREMGIKPGRILCLTFTRKAAAEMEERVRSMLAAAAQDDEVFATALKDMAESRISTLDSFCAEIARNSSAGWGVPGDFSVDDALALDSGRNAALDFLLDKRKEKIIEELIAWNGLENTVVALRDVFNKKGGAFGAEENWASQETAGVFIKMILDRCHNKLLELLAGGLSLEGTSAVALSWQEASQEYVDKFTGAPDFFKSDESGSWLSEYQRFTGLAKPRGQNELAGYYNPLADEIKQYFNIIKNLGLSLIDKRLIRLDELLREFILNVREQRRTQRILSYSDVAWMAKEALLLDIDLRNYYKKHFDVIMVDEFQDDNELQKDILFLIAEDRDIPGQKGKLPRAEELRKGALFFVGDEKQSIYAFRGADVSVFRSLADDLKDSPGGLAEHRLFTNWRSEPHLIDFFNQTFMNVFPAPDQSGTRAYEARFEPLGKAEPTAGADPLIEYIELAETGDDEIPVIERQAMEACNLIKELVEKGVKVAAKSTEGKISRPCQWEDIAILFRATTQQKVFERYLRLMGIPYSVNRVAGLFAESVLVDIYHALKLVVMPHDRLALASWLRGPFARLSDPAIVKILSLKDEEGQWYGAFPSDCPHLEAEDKKRYRLAEETYRLLCKKADRESIAGIVSFLWNERGLRWNVLSSRGNEAYLEHFDYIWALANLEDRKAGRLSDFIQKLEEVINSDEKTDEINIVRESASGINIMTVHASKGLEFPVVLIPDCQNKGRPDTSGIISMDKTLGVSARLPGIGGHRIDHKADAAKILARMDRQSDERIMDERLAEISRLFYVACTRAISRLYLLSSVPRNTDRDGSSFRGLLLRAFPWAGPSSRSDEATREAPKSSILKTRLIQSIPDTRLIDSRTIAGPEYLEKIDAWAPPASRMRWSVTAAAAFIQSRGEEPIPTRQNAESGIRDSLAESSIYREIFSEADFGTLCHEILASKLTRPGGDVVLSSSIKSGLKKLPASLAKKTMDEALDLSDAFLASTTGKAAIDAARKKHSEPGGNTIFHVEYPFLFLAGAGSQKRWLSGSIDLIFQDGDKLRIIDFKTDSLEDPERHSFQLAVYREAAQDIFGMNTSSSIYYLRSGKTAVLDSQADFGALLNIWKTKNPGQDSGRCLESSSVSPLSP